MKRYLLVALLVSGLLPGRAPAAAPVPTVMAFNSVTDMLAGDMWDVVYPWDLREALRDYPADWLLLGLGTTTHAFANGEVVARGTVARPELLYCDPEWPQVPRAVTEAMPFLGLAVVDPSTAVAIAARRGEDVHAQVRALCEAKGWPLAAVSVHGRCQGVSGTIAHDLRKSGSPLGDYRVDKAEYLLPFAAAEARPWQILGAWAGTAAGQRCMSIAGHPLHLHGVSDDGQAGGHIGKATADDAIIRVYPVAQLVERQADLTVQSAGRVAGGLVFQVANVGQNRVLHVPVRISAGNASLWQMQLGELAPGVVREVTVPLALPTGRIEIVVDPANQVLESNEANNRAVL